MDGYCTYAMSDYVHACCDVSWRAAPSTRIITVSRKLGLRPFLFMDCYVVPTNIPSVIRAVAAYYWTTKCAL